MAKFAPVAPIQILEQMAEHDYRTLFGNYHLLLAHHVAEYPERFTELFKKSVRAFYSDFKIIMDNSVVELGGHVSLDLMKQSCGAISAGFKWLSSTPNLELIAVLPDVMGDSKKTIEVVRENYANWVAAKIADSYMLVTQGNGWDFLDTINYFLIERREYYSHINWVGIPRVLRKHMSRNHAIKYIQMVRPDIKIHLLGFADSMLDDFQCARIAGVTGIDSAVPVRHSGLLLPTTVASERPLNWFKEGRLDKQAQINIANVRKWVSC